jgi:putative ABC transport system permease protein
MQLSEGKDYASQRNLGSGEVGRHCGGGFMDERPGLIRYFLEWLETLGQDVRLIARSLPKSPGFLLVVVFSLALGIGANSTIFSVIDNLLYRPLPYPHPQQLVAIWETHLNQPGYAQPPIAESVDWKKQNDVFQDIALTSMEEDGVLSREGSAERIHVEDVTPNFFELLGAKPILGRISFPSEMQDHSQTVVISYRFWKTHFNKSPNVLGKTFQVSGLHSTVVGVMREGFTSFYAAPIDVWQPIDAENKRYSERADHWLVPIGRLKPSTTLAQAQAEMDTIARRLEQQYPTTNKGVGKRLVLLHEELFGWARQALYPLFGAVAFVLLIACANVANLLQSRTETRRPEFAVRLSLGASRARLIQQSLVESLLLGLSGALLGLVLAYWGIRLFLWLAGSDFPDANSITVDLRVVLFALGVALLTTLLFGLAPAFQSSRSDLSNTLRDGAHGTLHTATGYMRRLLAVSEVAMAMVLLVGTGLMINTILHLRRVDPGFDSASLLTVGIALPEAEKYMERVPGGDMERAKPAVNSFYEQLLERVAALTGVESVGSITGLPAHFSEDPTFSILGHPAPPPDQRPQAQYGQATPNFFRTLRIPLKRGRYLDDHDTNAAPWVIVVNEAFVRRFFPNEDPIGKQVRLRYDPYPTEEDRPRQIVGVVGDIKQNGLGRPAPPFIYASFFQQPDVYPGGFIVSHLWQDLAIRTASTARAAELPNEIRQIVAELDPDQPIGNFSPMDRIFVAAMGVPEFYMQLLSLFAGVAVFLAGIGIYGVISYFVSQHTHDIGIRMALGAHPKDILQWITKLGLKLVTIGIVVGIALALGLSRLLSAVLFGVTPTDPATYLVVALVLMSIAAIACYIPARRATKVDPMVALRYE